MNTSINSVHVICDSIHFLPASLDSLPASQENAGLLVGYLPPSATLYWAPSACNSKSFHSFIFKLCRMIIGPEQSLVLYSMSDKCNRDNICQHR